MDYNSNQNYANQEYVSQYNMENNINSKKSKKGLIIIIIIVLLIAGLGLIGFVMYKEIKKSK